MKVFIIREKLQVWPVKKEKKEKKEKKQSYKNHYKHHKNVTHNWGNLSIDFKRERNIFPEQRFQFSTILPSNNVWVEK